VLADQGEGRALPREVVDVLEHQGAVPGEQEGELLAEVAEEAWPAGERPWLPAHQRKGRGAGLGVEVAHRLGQPLGEEVAGRAANMVEPPSAASSKAQ
jgi:hypothetical protein